MLLNWNKIQPVLELRAEYPGVCCVYAFFLAHGEICSWCNLWLNYTVIYLKSTVVRSLMKYNLY